MSSTPSDRPSPEQPPGYQPGRVDPSVPPAGSWTGAPAETSFPAPQGWTPPSGWAPPPPGWAGPPRAVAAHRPGAVPLRPLKLGDLIDAAFKIVRYNARATVGSALCVSAAAMAVPLLVTTITTFTIGASLETRDDGSISTADLTGLLVSVGSLLLGSLLLQLGLVLVSGVVSRVTREAALGRTMTMGEAWAATRGSRGRLVGLMVVTFLIGLGVFAVAALLVVAAVLSGSVVAIVLTALVAVAGAVVGVGLVTVRLTYLAPAALVLEDLGPFAAIGRGYRLTARSFWRTLGILLLTALMAGVAGSVISVPASFGGQIFAAVKPEYAVLGLAVAQAVGTTISSALTAPFKAAMATLQYLDLRMRKEAYDVDLMREAGLL